MKTARKKDYIITISKSENYTQQHTIYQQYNIMYYNINTIRIRVYIIY